MSDNGRAAETRVLDVLIAGGGPGGTATAFRARELGLEVLIVEYDDLMKRIRDYSKDKLILPGFGGGDRMKFPRGGPLIDALRFAPIDKDEICACWKGLHAEHGIGSRIGAELTGIERRDDGVYEVLCWDHTGRCDVRLLARSVVLAIGRGVPRRFDIPGNTEGIAYRLDDPKAYVGRPACVVGGGTSAAEAVIAISGAKAAAGDDTAVYWSYRGDRMPRVSKALAEVFFEAYVGHGNIRYYPRSEPASVLVGDDHREYLSIRVDRRPIAGRPTETSHLEFAKDCCIACIGEDIPEGLLADLGVPMAVGGPRNKKRMLVNRHLESVRENVFLVGDLLSQAYFETDDFDADPASYREVKHRGNIKSALRDGVLVAEVIRQKLDGKRDIEVRLEDAEEVAPPSGSAAFAVAAGGSGVIDAGPPPASVAPERAVEESAAAYLIRALPSGELEDEYPLADHGVVTIGRGACDLSFPDDTLLSDRHASVAHGEQGFFLRDDGSEGGVYLRLPVHRKIEVTRGDLICAGRQFLLVGHDGDGFEIVHYDQHGNEVGRHRLGTRTAIVGRKAPDIVLDPGDRTLSRRQLALTVSEGRLLIKDLKSANGTFLRVRSAIPLEHGDRFRVGTQHFVFSLDRDAVLDAGHEAQPPAAPAAAAPAADIDPDAPSVTFAGLGSTFPAEPGQTICAVAEANGVTLNAECHSGICGSDPVRILAGREHLQAEAGDEESDTLEDLCGLTAGDCRLACMARIKGPVTVEIL